MNSKAFELYLYKAAVKKKKKKKKDVMKQRQAQMAESL